MPVDTFDPSALGNPMDEAAWRDLCAFAADFEAEVLDLSELEVARFAALSSHPDWAQKAGEIEADATLESLIRIFTLGEMQYSSWVADDKSPVIALVRELKRRGSFDPALTRWIKAHTSNRFLPHGSLMDRL
jgi:hypothetical protein